MKPGLKGLLVWLIAGAMLTGTAHADLAQRIDSIISSQSQSKVDFAVQILDPASGSILYSRNASTPMIPASNMKLVTTAAALKYLGPDFFYETRVGLVGDALAVIGSGDPLLGDKPTMQQHDLDPRWMLKDIADQLRQNNITTVSDIIVDSSVFDDERVHPNWPQDQLNRWYACEVSGLNFNGNCVDVIAETIGSRVNITLDPPTRYVEIINKCKPASKGPDTVWCARPPGSNVITVLGACNRRCQPVRVAIDRPGAFFGFVLAEELKFRGISVNGRLLGQQVSDDDPFKRLAVYRSSIWDVLDRCNKDSLGLAAEALMKTISASRQPSGKHGSWESGQRCLSDYLLSLGVPTDQFTIDDGSGLSKKNLLSANAISAVLLDLCRNKNWPRYKETLAVGGLDGTVAKYFSDPKYKGKIFGKTGYVAGVKSFSGVCSTPAGDRIFAILTNSANGGSRQAINRIVTTVIDESE